MYLIRAFCIILFISLIFIFSSCSVSKRTLKYSDNFAIKSEPVNIKYKIAIGRNIEGSATITKLFWFFQFPTSIDIADNIYSIDNEASLVQSAAEGANNAINQLGTVPFLFGLIKPITDLFKGDNLVNLSKSAALYNACKTDGYNVVLTPIYECKIQSFIFFKRVTTTLKAKGAYITKVMTDDTADSLSYK